MTKEDIIRMAREAGFRDTTTPVVALGVSWEQVQRFAALVAEYERNACAQVVEAIDRNGAWVTKEEAAAAIRARGEK
jgi:protein tyrosine phosphatase (PTP) superfamily phosphohydrolase (DUF442 family)